MSKICFITCIYGKYERSCKTPAKQTVETDFICFTDDPNIAPNGWTVDTTPYHLTHPSPLDRGSYRNSLSNNKHTFNVSKYYKQAFQNIPRLQKYDAVVWLDGTIEVTCESTSAYLLKHLVETKIVAWSHEMRYGILADEVRASHFERYTSTFWNGQAQPYQDVEGQYRSYLEDGYTDHFFDRSTNPHMGVWITCFVAFLNHDAAVHDFLNLWYLQTLTHTTQDQISFPYVCQKKLVPFTLPNDEVWGPCPHQATMFYKKHSHGV